MNVKNEFFDSADSPFEVVGFFEEFIHAQTYKLLGRRYLSVPTRPCGSSGRVTYELKENLDLIKGIDKPVTIKASTKKPVPVTSMIQIICGRKK